MTSRETLERLNRCDFWFTVGLGFLWMLFNIYCFVSFQFIRQEKGKAGGRLGHATRSPVQGLGFRVKGSGFWVLGLGFGFRV